MTFDFEAERRNIKNSNIKKKQEKKRKDETILHQQRFYYCIIGLIEMDITHSQFDVVLVCSLVRQLKLIRLQIKVSNQNKPEKICFREHIDNVHKA